MVYSVIDRDTKGMIRESDGGVLTTLSTDKLSVHFIFSHMCFSFLRKWLLFRLINFILSQLFSAFLSVQICTNSMFLHRLRMFPTIP